MSNDNKKENLIINNDNEHLDSYLEVSRSFSISSAQLDNYIEDKDMKDIESLVEMGFPKKTIKKVYAFLNPINISQAITFLTEQNGIYNHEFYEFHNKHTDKCFICGEDRTHHNNSTPKIPNNIINKNSFVDSLDSSYHDKLSEKGYFDKINFLDDDNNEKNININILENQNQNNNNNNINNNNNNNNNNINNNNNNINNNNNELNSSCLLCEEILTENDLKINTLPCKHKFCEYCWLEYLKEKISNSRVKNITCMENKCKTELNENFILSIIGKDETLKSKYEKFKLKENILNNPNMKFCPYPDCDSYAEKKKSRNVRCKKNNHEFCFECLKKWHFGSCSNNIDKDFVLWKKNKLVKQCPKCKMWTEKNEGCNHMTCAECHYQWCWLCREAYSENHYEVGGTCAGLQFEDDWKYQNCFCLYFYKLFVFYGMLIVMFLFGLPVFVFIGFTEFVEDVLDSEYINSTLMLSTFIVFYFICYEVLCLEIFSLVVIAILSYHPLLGLIMEIVH